MYKKILSLLFVMSMLHESILHPHGFGKDTQIQLMDDSDDPITIEEAANRIKNHAWFYIAAYDIEKNRWCAKRVVAAGRGTTNCYCRLLFNKHEFDNKDDIICTPIQLFLRMPDKEWVPAYKLAPGERLLCNDNKLIELVDINLVDEPLTVYALEIKNLHTFLVGNRGIVTHNMVVPLLASFGLSIPFGSAGAGTAGGFFGPVGFIGGIALGSLIGCVVNRLIKESFGEYSAPFDMMKCSGSILEDDVENYINKAAKAPGKPGSGDGFKPKKGWNGEKTHAPEGGGYGYPDEKGHVWVPAGEDAHRGPHWDVQDENGDHRNVMPGGKVLG